MAVLAVTALAVRRGNMTSNACIKGTGAKEHIRGGRAIGTSGAPDGKIV